MASGIGHARAERFWFWPISAVVAALWLWFPSSLVSLVPGRWLLIAAAGYWIGHLWLTPDLDMWGSAAFRRMGPLKYLFWPYSALFRHRGWSHNVLVGTVTRIGYVTLLTIPLWAWVDWSWYPEVIGPLFAGCWVCNCLHLLYDL